MNQIIDFLKEQGAKIIILPFFKPEVLVATYYIIAMAETASNLSRLT
jgi:aspartyl-tRNA(Asn)/glutamyl-tRNA(Gln) amidotransferase subunit A